MAVEEWIFAPGLIVDCGPIVTKYESRVGVSVDEEDEDEDRDEDEGAAPMTVFSPMMHPSPTIMGPS